MMWWYLKVSFRLAAERETTGGSVTVQLFLDATLKLIAALVEEQYMDICITNASCVCVLIELQ